MYSTPVTITPPRVPIEYEADPVIALPSRAIKEIRPRVVYQDFEPAPTTITDLPRDVLVELLINLPPGKLTSLCRTNVSLSRLCNDEQFLSELIGRKYKITVNKIPGQTIKEKYAFISQFDPRYFTDPDFVKINPSYKRDFGLKYTSRENPNDALNTIMSITIDSQKEDEYDESDEGGEDFGVNVTIRGKYEYGADDQFIPGSQGASNLRLTRLLENEHRGAFNLRLTRLLSGAVMTKSQAFVKQVLQILTEYLLETYPSFLYVAFQRYGDSFRYPFILSIEYDMKDTTSLLAQYYDYRKDRHFVNDAVDEIAFTDSINILDYFLPYFDLNENLFRRLMEKGKYELVDHVSNKLASMEKLSAARRSNLTSAINSGNINTVRYLMKYIVPTQEDIYHALEIGAVKIGRILYGEEILDE